MLFNLDIVEPLVLGYVANFLNPNEKKLQNLMGHQATFPWP